MWIVALALRRPYTFIVMALVIIILTPITILRTPTDIFPDIDIPVVSVVWFYTGMSPQDMADRIVANSERGITTTVNDIEHMESQSVYGLGVIKVFFRPGTNVQGAIAQITAICQTTVRGLPPGTTPPLIISYSASTTPIIQLGLSSKTLAGTATVRPWPELSAYLSGHRAGSRHPVSLTAARFARFRWTWTCRSSRPTASSRMTSLTPSTRRT
jgi:multidrug efflux pump subunit AcrB